MHRAKVTSKGQVTIPAKVRKAMSLRPGSSLVFFEGEDGDFVLKRARSAAELEGCLTGHEVPQSDEEVNDLLHRRAADLDRASKSRAGETPDGEAA